MCFNCKPHTITINQLPTASFTFSSPTCAGLPVAFTSTATPNSGILNTWYWDYGDGAKDTLFNANPFTHTYTIGGTYTVTLKVKTDKGCFSSVFTQPVVIRATPIPDFTLPGNLCLPNASATFINTTTISDGTLPSVTYIWDFGDASPTSNAISPTHIYTGVGPYTVTLTATSNNLCSKSISKILNTIFAQPVASFNAPLSACNNSTVSFTNTSTAAGSAIASYSWNFGDPASGVNNTSSSPNPTHVFSGTGNFTVSLIVTNMQGCPSVAFTQQIVIDALPIAAFTFPAIRCVGNDIAFTDASTPNSATITNWSWDFGDPVSGANNTSTLQNPTHSFSSAGTYTVTLSVKNSNNCTSNIVAIQNVVINPNPFAKFTVSNICVPNGFAQFTNTSTISSGTINGWLWDFGDATPTSNLQHPTHNYATGGIKNVHLTVTSALGCAKDTFINVSAFDAPTSNYSINNVANLCSNIPVTLTNNSTVVGFGAINKVEIFWDYLNDPTNSTIDNAPITNGIYNHTYPTFGTPLTKMYRVLLRSTSGTGCTNDYFTDIIINAAPQAQLLDFTPVCQEQPAVILTQGSDLFNLPGIGLYSGNGILVSPVFVPQTAGVGTHIIRYTYTALNGCSSYVEKPLIVNPTPLVNLGPDKKVIEGDILTIIPQNLSGNGLSYLWTPATYFTTNTVSANAVVKPTADITYTLTVTSADGCVASDDVFVKVVKDFIVPNTFTPNNDGINDTWIIQYLDLYPSQRIQVFNRLGQLVFESKNYTKPWDGKYGGKLLPTDTYYYIIDLGGARKTKTGYVTIVR